jgi:PTH1 family peptidyl-tRNA hydrolase
MKYLITGLGNPGSEYEGTRHNIGFEVLDLFADLHKASFQSEKYGHIAKLSYRSRSLILLKPNTFMNLSGKAVAYWMGKASILPENVLVITDDIALDAGVVRLRKSGSDGGHNGLKSIIASLGHNQFPRLRVGVGHDFPKGRQADFVLSPWPDNLRTLLEAVKLHCVKTTESFATIGADLTMNQYNGTVLLPE